MQNKFIQKFGYDLSFMENVKSTGTKSLDNIEITIMGISATIVDFTFLNTALIIIRPWIQSFIYFMLALYHINSIYKMIRGTSLIELKLAEVNIHNSMNDRS